MIFPWFFPFLMAAGFLAGRRFNRRLLRLPVLLLLAGSWCWLSGRHHPGIAVFGLICLFLGLLAARKTRGERARLPPPIRPREEKPSAMEREGTAPVRGPEEAVQDLLRAASEVSQGALFRIYLWSRGPEGPEPRYLISSTGVEDPVPALDQALARRLIREHKSLSLPGREGQASSLLLRLGEEEDPQGIFEAQGKDSDGGPPEGRALLENFARSVSDILRAEQTLAQVEEDRASWRSAMSVGGVLASTLDVDEVMGAALEALVELCKASSGYFILFKKGGVEPGTIKARDYEDSRVRRESQEPETLALFERLCLDGQPRVLEPGERGFPALLVPDSGAPDRILIVPLKEGLIPLGLLKLDGRGPSPFSPTQVRIVGLLSDLLSMAVRNARLHRDLNRSAETDPLTGLFNRAGFVRQGKARLARAAERGELLSLALVDLDHFKRVNDTWGHGEGDRVLKEAARILGLALREEDLIGRWGGEEIVVLLPNRSSSHAEKALDQARKDLQKGLIAGQGKDSWPITFSAGVAAYRPGVPKPAPGPEAGHPARSESRSLDILDALVQAADKALYKAKEQGRNRVLVADD